MRIARIPFLLLSFGCASGAPASNEASDDDDERAGSDILCSCDCITCQRYDGQPRMCVEEAREGFVAPACLPHGAEAMEACTTACSYFGHDCMNAVPLGEPGAPCAPTESG